MCAMAASVIELRSSCVRGRMCANDGPTSSCWARNRPMGPAVMMSRGTPAGAGGVSGARDALGAAGRGAGAGGSRSGCVCGPPPGLRGAARAGSGMNEAGGGLTRFTQAVRAAEAGGRESGGAASGSPMTMSGSESPGRRGAAKASPRRSTGAAKASPRRSRPRSSSSSSGCGRRSQKPTSGLAGPGRGYRVTPRAGVEARAAGRPGFRCAAGFERGRPRGRAAGAGEAIGQSVTGPAPASSGAVKIGGGSV
jgi:hypothetical protein